MAAATTSFLREAEGVLRGGGYKLERQSGKQHGVWRHPDPERPDIVVPKTPPNPDHALVHIRRAVRRGTSTHIPPGTEREMPKAPTKSERPLRARLLIEHATPEMQRRRDRIDRGEDQGEPLTAEILGKWLRKCLEDLGALPNAEINEAAEALHLTGPQLSVARTMAGAKSYRQPGSERGVYTTDFVGRIPAGAYTPPGRKPMSPPQPVTPAEVEKLGLSTPDENGSEKRDATAALDKILADHPDDPAVASMTVDPPGERSYLVVGDEGSFALREQTNGSRPRTQLDEALDLVREAALADTRALTSDDIELLGNIRDDLVRHRIDLETITSGLENLLTRVAPRVETHA